MAKIRQVDAVRHVMEGGEWFTLGKLQAAIKKQYGIFISEAGLSARIRDQRKAKHGGHVVIKRLMKPSRSLHQYKFVI